MENFEKLIKLLDMSITMRLNQIQAVLNDLGTQGRDNETIRTLLLEMTNSLGWLMHIQDKAFSRKMRELLPNDSQDEEKAPIEKM
jgi:hypothetical protein